jgi:glycosyltransferase involved in cell wall biosynthesis
VPKTRVLFVAGFERMADGGTGGQVAVATAVLNSELAKHVEFLPLSSTMQTLPPPPVWKRSFTALQRAFSFLNLLPSCDVAVIFASDGFSLIEKGLMCWCARLAGRGVVLRISNGNIPQRCASSSRWRTWLRIMLNSAHIVIAQGPFWTRYYSSYSEAQGKVVEIPNGIVLDEARSHQPLPRAFPSPPRVTYVGWMVANKGIYEILGVAAQLRTEFPDLKVYMAGGGELDEFREAVNKAGLASCIEIMGWQTTSSIQALLRRTTVFLLPSYSEGMPNALLEAMAARVPVVATSVGSIPDVISHGNNGLLVPVRDVTATTDAVRLLLRDPELTKRLGEEGARAVTSKYDIKLVWRLYAEAISKAARAAGRAGMEWLEQPEDSRESVAAGRPS